MRCRRMVSSPAWLPCQSCCALVLGSRC
uniref:Uncharacterized protein n=1 Tax=Arundo donax TaxID=35708 RepID=A0A0A9BDE9_ARUDO